MVNTAHLKKRDLKKSQLKNFIGENDFNVEASFERIQAKNEVVMDVLYHYSKPCLQKYFQDANLVVLLEYFLKEARLVMAINDLTSQPAVTSSDS